MRLGCLKESFWDSMTMFSIIWWFEVLASYQRWGKKKKKHNELRCLPITKGVQVDMDGISLLSNRPLGIRWLLNFCLILRLYDTEHCFIGCTFTYEIMNFLLYQFHLSPTIPPPIFSLGSLKNKSQAIFWHQYLILYRQASLYGLILPFILWG